MRVPTAVNLNIPVWILFLGSALVWYVSTLSQYIPLLGQYWLGWQYRFEPWQWVAAVCAVWALVVLVLLQDVRKYKILGQILAVVLAGFYVQKGYVEGAEFRQLMGLGLILLWFVLKHGLTYGMYTMELALLGQSSSHKTDFPACTVVIYDDAAYKVAASTLWILLCHHGPVFSQFIAAAMAQCRFGCGGFVGYAAHSIGAAALGAHVGRETHTRACLFNFAARGFGMAVDTDGMDEKPLFARGRVALPTASRQLGLARCDRHFFGSQQGRLAQTAAAIGTSAFRCRG